ncbi:MAG: helix-hairpin-helix domain-containing protein [Candidatus Hodarchaeota archaeon]
MAGKVWKEIKNDMNLYVIEINYKNRAYYQHIVGSSVIIFISLPVIILFGLYLDYMLQDQLVNLIWRIVAVVISTPFAILLVTSMILNTKIIRFGIDDEKSELTIFEKVFSFKFRKRYDSEKIAEIKLEEVQRQGKKKKRIVIIMENGEQVEILDQDQVVTKSVIKNIFRRLRRELKGILSTLDLEKLKGVGVKRARKLVQSGYTSFEKIIKTDIKKFKKDTGFSLNLCKKIKASALELTEGH